MLTIAKQPGADTRLMTDAMIAGASKSCKPSLAGRHPHRCRSIPADVSSTAPSTTCIEALRDGGILVVIILFLFLLNFRTTFITLTAIPLSIVITGLVFKWFGMSINTMTLGGLAVAIGELVDDAIVDVENIFRRLQREPRVGRIRNPRCASSIEASSEVRNSIVFSTMIVCWCSCRCSP